MATDSLPKNMSDTTIPVWLRTRYPADVPRSYDTVRQEIIKFRKRPGGLSYCIYEQADGNCLRTFLAVFEGPNIRDSINMDISCDHDQVFATYRWTESRQLNDTFFYVTSYTKRLPDKYVMSDGYLKEGLDFMELENETILDSSRLEVRIGPEKTEIYKLSQ